METPAQAVEGDPGFNEKLARLTQRFDEITDYEQHSLRGAPLAHYGGPGVWFKREVDPDTQETTSRSVFVLGRDGPSAEYGITDTGITLTTVQDDVNEQSVVEEDGGQPEQNGRLYVVGRHIDKAVDAIKAHQSSGAGTGISAKEREKFIKSFAPGLGKKLLKAVGISGPYNRQQQKYQNARQNLGGSSR